MAALRKALQLALAVCTPERLQVACFKCSGYGSTDLARQDLQRVYIARDCIGQSRGKQDRAIPGLAGQGMTRGGKGS